MTDTASAPLPGSRVTVTSVEGSRVFVAEADGKFFAPYLTPGLYAVRVELPGFAAVERHGIEVRLGRRVELAFALPPGVFKEALEVKGAPPMVDFSSATVSTGVSSSFLAKIPVARRLSDVLYVAPSVSSSGGLGVENPSISGASGLENQYVMDGVTINDPQYGGLGLYSRSYGSLGMGVTYELIDQIQVKTAGSDAEYGQSTGGLVNVITKSGSNSWHGSMFAYLRPERFEGAATELVLTNSGTTTIGDESRDLGFTFGGPLVKDHAFFYVALDPQYERTTFLAPPGYPLRSLGGVDRERRSTPYAAKVTIESGPGNRIDVSLFGDPSTSPRGPQSSRAMTGDSTASFDSLDYGGDNQTIHYQGLLAPAWLLEASIGRARQVFEDTPYLDQWSIRDQTVKPTKRSGGKGSYDSHSEGTSLQYEAKSTYLLGSHEIRFGGSYESTDMETNSALTGPTVTLPDGQQTSSGVSVTIYPDSKYGQIYRVSQGLLFSQQRSNVDYLGLFMQDKVQVGPRLTISAGLRYERERMAGSAESFAFGDNWAPRLGFAYDPTGKGKLKVFGSFGVFFAKIPSDLAVTAFSPYGRVTRADYFDAALTQPVPEGVLAGGTTTHFLTKGASAAIIDPTSELGFIREGALGFEFQVASQLSLGMRYVHRETPRVLEDVTNVAMVLYAEHLPGLSNVQYVITNPRANYPATLNGVGAFENPIHDYDAIELTADKRFANGWALLASYRWSRLWGTYEGFYYNGLDEPKPGETTFDDYPTNDPSYTQIGVPQYGFTGDVRYLGQLGAGPLPNDRTHQVKVYASYAFQRGLDLGAGFSASSGQPLTPDTSDPISGHNGFILLGPRGSGMMTQDGFKARMPWVWSLDLHADYAFRIRQGRLLLSVDVANVFNRQAVTGYDQDTDRSSGLDNPDFGKRTSYQDPRQVRLGIRLEM
ncbi:MAG: TonB-dependent receptor [Acidobacteriia bacterium]|nr:TonB-dependent receptor [Terriglobia bacterium]